VKVERKGENPEHIAVILERFFEKLLKIYEAESGGLPKGPGGDALHIPGLLSLAGRGNQSEHLQG
jgi:hypothetical protein